MHNPGDDKELDRLSREAAGQYTPPGKANWQALSEELDRIMPVTEKKKRRFLFWWLLPLLLIGGGAAYWMGTHPSVDDLTVTAKSDAGTVSGEEKTTTTQNNPSSSQKTTVEDSQQEAAKKKEQGSTQDEAIQPMAKQPKIASRLPVTQSLRSVKNNNRPGKPIWNDRSSGVKTIVENKAPATASNTVTTSDKKTDLPLPVAQPATEKTATNTTAQLQKTEAEQPQNKLSEKTIAPVTSAEPEPAKTEEAVPASVTRVSSSRGKGFSYAIVAGVDKSTVKFRYGNDPGVNLGLMGGYHFNNRWSVHTGLIYTQKNYKVAGKDFTAPKGSWISYYKLESITGYCRMWELPLQVRYTMGKTESKSSFFSVGLSSYFMTKESYDYFYYYNNQPVTRNNTLDSDDQHILSIAHFSVGFENKISKKWALQVEPYAKIPMGGVGFGSIRLSSFGLNFSLQHRQPAKK
jgi:hypothetical protein